MCLELTALGGVVVEGMILRLLQGKSGGGSEGVAGVPWRWLC